MSRLLTYLAGLPHHGSPLSFPTLYTLAKSMDVAEWPSRLHPSLEGRGQVAVSFGVEGPKKNERV